MTKRDPLRPQLRLRRQTDGPARLEDAAREKIVRLLAQLLTDATAAAPALIDDTEGRDEGR